MNQQVTKEEENIVSSDGTKIDTRRHPAVVIYASLLIIFVGIIITPKLDFNNPWNVIANKFEAAKKISDPNARNQVFVESLREMIELRDKFPYHGRLYLNTAYLFFSAGMMDSAIHNSSKALELGGGGTVNKIDQMAFDIFTKATIQKAGSYFSKGDTANSLLTFKKSLYMMPTNPAISRIIGNFYANFGSTDSAFRYLANAQKFAPNDADIYYSIGLSYFRLKKFDSAQIFLNYSLKINPNYQNSKELLNQINKVGK